MTAPLALLALVAVPLVTGTVLSGLALGDDLTASARRRAGALTAVRVLSVAGSVLTLVAAALAATGGGRVDLAWLPGLGVRLALGLDGLSAPHVLLTAVAGLAAVLITGAGAPPAGHGVDEADEAGLHGALHLVVGAALLAFAAQDAVLLVIALELALVPMWLVIRRYGDTPDRAVREAASGRFLLFTAAGSALVLVGVLLMTSAAGTSDLRQLTLDGVPLRLQAVAAGLVLTGLAVKVPAWPLHSWLPGAHSTAPTGGSMLLAAVLLKLGTYGMLRLVAGPMPQGFLLWAPALAVLGVAGLVWGALACLAETDLKRFVAWSSVAHMGLVLLALGSATLIGLQSAVLASIAHGLVAIVLFCTAGAWKHRWGSGDMTTTRPALREGAPWLGAALITALAAGSGVPGLAPFWGEVGAVAAGWLAPGEETRLLLRSLTVVAVGGLVLVAAGVLRVIRLVWMGERSEGGGGDGRPDATPAERVVLTAALLATVALGLYPHALLEVTDHVLGQLPLLEEVSAR